nr:MAG TPA: hypothetical protein [Caudoviricetes sp.]
MTTHCIMQELLLTMCLQTSFGLKVSQTAAFTTEALMKIMAHWA